MRILVTSSLLALAASAQQGEEAKLLLADAAPNDRFGRSVSVSGERLLVGAPSDDEPDNSGRAYVYERVAGVWLESATLQAPDAKESDLFGHDLAIHGDLAAVSAPGDDDGGSESGSVYVFERGPAGWSFLTELHAPDAHAFDQLGSSVSVHGDTILVGASSDDDLGSLSGSAYLFERTSPGAPSWTFSAKLLAGDGSSGAFFGWSTSLGPDRALVGAYGADVAGSPRGAAYVFDRLPSGWVQTAKLVASDGEVGDRFGTSVSLWGDRALIGSYRHDHDGAGAGAAYVFDLVGSSWIQMAELQSDDEGFEQEFGSAVALFDERALIGSRADGPDKGAAYSFERGPTGWEQRAKIEASDGGSGDEFGASVAYSGGFGLVGAPSDDEGALHAGAAYVVRVDPILLQGDVAQLSVASGGAQSFGLDAGPVLALSPYLLLGTTSGTSPGLSLDGFVLPLNVDAYTIATLNGPNKPPLLGSFGALDSIGLASASFTLPVGLAPSFAGLEVHHAFLVLETTPTLLGIAGVSNAVRVVLVH